LLINWEILTYNYNIRKINKGSKNLQNICITNKEFILLYMTGDSDMFFPDYASVIAPTDRSSC